MKKILKHLPLIALFGSLLMANSCSEDFLTKEPGGVVPKTITESPDGVEALLIGTYERMTGEDRFGGAMATDWTYGSGASDDAYKGSEPGDQSAYNDVEKYTNLPSSPYVRGRWRDCYGGVARANVTLDILAKVQASPTPVAAARALQIEAEAKFLRAWFHFQANKVFEKIPYIKTAEELGTVKPEMVPNTDSGWEGIEADLQFAIDNLPAKFTGEPGRATKYAAEAVKAHAFMNQGKFAQAKTLLDDIITNGGFSLVADYYDNYSMTTENNKESIFEIQASTTATSVSSLMLGGPVMHQKGPASCGGWGFYQPSQNLFEAFQVGADGLPILDPALRVSLANDMGKTSSATFIPTTAELDPRVDWTIARRGVDFLGWGIHPGNDWIRYQSNGGPYMTKKYMHKKEEQGLNSNGTGFDNGKNFRMYRYAHVLLWRAEVAIEEGGAANLELARGYINQIRNRAKTGKVVMGLCTKYASLGSVSVADVDYTKPAANYKCEPYPLGHVAFTSQAGARKALREEFRLEFATEGLRFFDLRRWGIADQVLNAYIAKDITFRSFLTGAVYNPTEDDYWPLPQDQLDLQKGILTQDASY